MIKDLIINDVERDINGLETLIKNAEKAPGTKLPVHCSSSTNNENKIKHGLFYASVLASTVAGAVPDFKDVNFSNQSNGKAIEMYHRNVEAPINCTLLEYKLLYEYSDSMDGFLNELLSFKSLVENWDGYGALPTEIKSATQAINLARKLGEKNVSKISDMYPNPNGTVTLEWENHSGEKLVAEIGNQTFSYFLQLNSLDPKFFNKVQITDDTVNVLSSHIKKLFI